MKILRNTGVALFGDEGGSGGQGDGQTGAEAGGQQQQQQTPASETGGGGSNSPSGGGEGGSQTPSGTGGQQQQTPQAVALSPEQFQQILQTVQPPQQQQQKRTYTQEDYDRAFNVVRPTAAQLEALKAGGDAAVVAMTELLHGAARQGSTLAAYQIQMIKEELMQQMQPLVMHVSEQRKAQLKTKFFDTHKDLKDYEPIIDKIADALVASGFKPKTEKEAFDAVAEQARAIIAKLPLGQQQQQQHQQQSQQTHRMSTLSTGGQGGVGGTASGSGGQKSNGLAVFD